MRFVDEVKIRATGGDGGNGGVYWRREKYVPEGGPDGGNGGNGGAVILVADSALNTLIDLSFQPHLRAESGEAGGTSRCDGRAGSDCVRTVPSGTQVFYGERLVADLNRHGATWVAARGGEGGKGNAFFATSARQAPDYAEKGQAGEDIEFRLVLKSIADVGLIGLPNVGKSTLISSVSSARPAVADYPFTTLHPQLGVVVADSLRRFVIADIPGLIPGAHKGRGLGINFLKHIERTAVLAQLIDVSTAVESGGEAAFDNSLDDASLIEIVNQQFEIIDTELRLFSASLLDIPRLLVFTKADLPQNRRAYELTKRQFAEQGYESVLISSPNREGLPELTRLLADLVERRRKALRDQAE